MKCPLWRMDRSKMVALKWPQCFTSCECSLQLQQVGHADWGEVKWVRQLIWGITRGITRDWRESHQISWSVFAVPNPIDHWRGTTDTILHWLSHLPTLQVDWLLFFLPPFISAAVWTSLRVVVYHVEHQSVLSCLTVPVQTCQVHLHCCVSLL